MPRLPVLTYNSGTREAIARRVTGGIRRHRYNR